MPPKWKRTSQACIQCRNRKIRCNPGTAEQCEYCAKVNLPCKKVADRRRERLSSVDEFILKIELYESVFEKLRHNLAASSDILDALGEGRLPDLDLGNKSSRDSEKNSEKDSQKDSDTDDRPATDDEKTLRHAVLPTSENAAFLQANNFENDEYSVSVYGPTSVFDTESVARLNETEKMAELSQNPRIVQCVQLFFRWQYPDLHSFVFREAFLLDFFNPKPGSVYCSQELVFAVCALGALMLEDSELFNAAPSFYSRARESLMKKLDSPSTSSLQAFLLLGLYDVYNGRNNAGWMLTGDGFRMGFGIGFQLKPEKWALKGDISDITVSVRSRIFWGSFFADRFLSLIMGRPSVLKVDDLTIPVLINMPAIENIAEYTYPGTPLYAKASYIDVSNPLTSIIRLATIADDMLEELFSAENKSQVVLAHKLRLLNRYNERLFRWRKELPDILKWDHATLAQFGHDHTKMFMRYFYYLVLLCLNRPFVEVKTDTDVQLSSLLICVEAMDELHAAILSFVNHHGFRRCSILIVYASIISLSIFLLKSSSGDLCSRKEFEHLFYEFMTVLKMTTWKLGERSFNKVRGTILTLYGLDYNKLFETYVQRLQASGSDRLVAPNSLVALMYEDERKSYNDYPSLSALDSEFSGGVDFGGFGGPPVFMTSESTDWAELFPEYLSGM